MNFLRPGVVPCGSASKNCANISFQLEKWSGRSWAMIDLGCKFYIHVQLTFGAEPPTAQRELLFDTSSLRIIFKWFSLVCFEVSGRITFHARPVAWTSSWNSTRPFRHAGGPSVEILSRGDHGWRLTAGCKSHKTQATGRKRFSMSLLPRKQWLTVHRALD